MDRSSDKDPKDHLVDLFLRAPLGFLYELIDQYPTAVKRGKSQADVGLASLRSLANSASNQRSDVTVEMLEESASFLRIVSARLDAAAEKLKHDEPVDVEEPVVGYDSMTAKQVITLLDETDSKTLRKITAYESSNKKRKSVIAALEKHLNE